MADARRARAERRAALNARVAQPAPVGGPPRHSPSPAANAATGPAGNEQQASSLHPSVRRDRRTATPSLTPAGSCPHARCAPTDAQAALLMARELPRYRPSRRPLRGLAGPHRRARAGDVAHGAPPPPPQQDGALAPRHAAHGAPPLPSRQDDVLAPRCAVPWRDPSLRVPTHKERSCQEIPRLQENAPPLLEPPRQDRLLRQGMRHLPWRRRGTKITLRPHDGPRWPQQAVAPSLPSCVASFG
ncbi:hypothetical protein PSTG_18256 [Puccinia striiformis f. sp. tritici PST-78]|uniref:Uncharacterized protein n=1 Tax=Puccinia striiformis f. sp. tritici PST-78 TaxID=1165861 RepID=A0A0L0UNK3_9BASI|nr:hypothetical protein PSTG_18256 [Puccinia striiformis f. sp. tritici PST-78]